MMWAKIDSGWFDSYKFDTACAHAPRSEVMAAWAVLVAWTVRARCDGRLARRKAERVVEMACEPSAGAGAVVDALVAARLLLADDGGMELEVSGWADWQLARADQDEAREAASERQRRRRSGVGDGSHVTRDMSRSVTRDTHGHVTRESREAVTRESRNRREETRQDKTRTEESRADARERAHESTSLVGPVAVAVAASPLAPTAEAGEPWPAAAPSPAPSPAPMASREAEAILEALRSHHRLSTLATAEMASTLEGRRMSSGRTVAAVVAAIGDVAAKAVDGTSTQAMRSMLVGFCDRAGGARPSLAVVPQREMTGLGRSWSVGGGETWALERAREEAAK